MMNEHKIWNISSIVFPKLIGSRIKGQVKQSNCDYSRQENSQNSWLYPGFSHT